jgi:hypothetical protein
MLGIYRRLLNAAAISARHAWTGKFDSDSRRAPMPSSGCHFFDAGSQPNNVPLPVSSASNTAPTVPNVPEKNSYSPGGGSGNSMSAMLSASCRLRRSTGTL